MDVGWTKGEGKGGKNIGDKPKGMHWGTYRSLLERYDLLSGLSLLGLMQRLNIAQDALDRIQEDLPEEFQGSFRKRG